MKTDAATSPEYDRFTKMVGSVLSVPKAQAQRIVAQVPAPSKVITAQEREENDAVLRYLKEELDREEANASQIIRQPPQDTSDVL